LSKINIGSQSDAGTLVSISTLLYEGEKGGLKI